MKTRHTGPRMGFKTLIRSWRLRREARRLMGEFQRIAEAIGHSMYSQAHSPSQLKRLERVREIASELRALHFPHLIGGTR